MFNDRVAVRVRLPLRVFAPALYPLCSRARSAAMRCSLCATALRGWRVSCPVACVPTFCHSRRLVPARFAALRALGRRYQAYILRCTRRIAPCHISQQHDMYMYSPPRVPSLSQPLTVRPIHVYPLALRRATLPSPVTSTRAAPDVYKCERRRGTPFSSLRHAAPPSPASAGRLGAPRARMYSRRYVRYRRAP